MSICAVLETRAPFLRVLLIWVPYYLRDLKRGPNLENYSYIKPWKPQALFFEQGLGFRV